MTPVSRVPQGVRDFLWHMSHINARFEQVPFPQNTTKSLYTGYLAEHVRGQVKLAVGLLEERVN